MPRLSVIVTAYNIEDYIDVCLRSVAAQTFDDMEILVVDDGSTDTTPQRIAAFARDDPRFVPVLLPTNSPGGVATAANAGLDRATGTWVGFVDGDDFIESVMFERLVTHAEAHDADLAMCRYQEFDEATEARREPADAHRWVELDHSCYPLGIEERKRFLRFIAVPWRKLYRRDLLERNYIRFPVGDYFYEDNPFHWFSLTSARSLAVVPEVLCYHRVGRAGQTMAAADSRLLKIFAHHDTIHDWLDRHGILPVYATTLLGWVISQMEWISRRTPPELVSELYSILAPIFDKYSREQIDRALLEARKGVRAQRLSRALGRQSLAAFSLELSGAAPARSPLAAGLFHLRVSGVRETARITGRYLWDRGGRPRAVLRRLAGGRAGLHGREASVTQQDVMFGLMVVQQHLDRLEGELVRLADSLEEVRERQTSQQGRTDLDRSSSPSDAQQNSSDPDPWPEEVRRGPRTTVESLGDR